MQKFFACLIALVVIIHATCSHAQQGPFTGGVTAVRPIPPGGVANVFLLFGEEEVGAPNEFHYLNGQFDLSFIDDSGEAPFICEGGCTLSAEIDRWLYPVSLGNGCMVQDATLKNGTYTLGSYSLNGGKVVPQRTYTNVTATYSQMFCQQGVSNFWSGGSLTVRLK